MEVHPVSDIRKIVVGLGVLALALTLADAIYWTGYGRGDSDARAGFQAECQHQLELSTWNESRRK